MSPTKQVLFEITNGLKELMGSSSNDYKPGNQTSIFFGLNADSKSSSNSSSEEDSDEHDKPEPERDSSNEAEAYLTRADSMDF